MKARKKIIFKDPPKSGHQGRAVISGKIATIWMGKRIVRVYKSVERLTGRIAD